MIAVSGGVKAVDPPVSVIYGRGHRKPVEKRSSSEDFQPFQDLP
jgi:hypothetical protein